MIDTSDIKKVNRKLNRFSRRGGRAGDKRLKAHVQQMATILPRQQYPPLMKNPPQRYVRTFLFKNSWFSRRLGFGRYLLGNSAPYSKWVAHRKWQARIHKDPYRASRASKPWWIATDVTKPYDNKLAKVIGFRIVDEYNG